MPERRLKSGDDIHDVKNDRTRRTMTGVAASHKLQARRHVPYDTRSVQLATGDDTHAGDQED
jgi:hypothetical protein